MVSNFQFNWVIWCDNFRNGDLMTTESDLAYLRANLDLQKKRYGFYKLNKLKLMMNKWKESNINKQIFSLETIENQLQQTNECVVIFEKDIQENENIHISLLPKYSKIHRYYSFILFLFKFFFSILFFYFLEIFFLLF